MFDVPVRSEWAHEQEGDGLRWMKGSNETTSFYGRDRNTVSPMYAQLHEKVPWENAELLAHQGILLLDLRSRIPSKGPLRIAPVDLR
jgi:hypothetical protein